MSDIRINALATTATSSASDDYVAIDGSANGTRKLSAYSPTFGGNLTVSGTGTSSIGTTTGFSYATVPTAGFSVGAIGTGGSFMVQTPSLSSSYGSGLAVDGTYTSGKSVINLKAFGVNSGGPYSADLAFYTSSSTTLAEQMRLFSSGNLFIGASPVDGGQKLQVNGTAYVSGDATFAGQVNILNSNSYIKADSSNLVYETYAGKAHQFKTGGTTALTLDSSQNATFAGSIAINNTVQTAAAVASTHKVTISIGGTTYYLLATNV